MVIFGPQPSVCYEELSLTAEAQIQMQQRDPFHLLHAVGSQRLCETEGVRQGLPTGPLIQAC